MYYTCKTRVFANRIRELVYKRTEPQDSVWYIVLDSTMRRMIKPFFSISYGINIYIYRTICIICTVYLFTNTTIRMSDVFAKSSVYAYFLYLSKCGFVCSHLIWRRFVFWRGPRTRLEPESMLLEHTSAMDRQYAYDTSTAWNATRNHALRRLVLHATRALNFNRILSAASCNYHIFSYAISLHIRKRKCCDACNSTVLKIGLNFCGRILSHVD